MRSCSLLAQRDRQPARHLRLAARRAKKRTDVVELARNGVRAARQRRALHQTSESHHSQHHSRFQRQPRPEALKALMPIRRG